MEIVRLRQGGHPPGASRPEAWAASDEAVLAGLGTGDEVAASVFVSRFQHRVVGLARGILGDDGRAADVAQEAFVRAWRHASTYDPARGPVTTWLLAITRNLAIDRLRMEQSRPAYPLDRIAIDRIAIDRSSLSASSGSGGLTGEPHARGGSPEDLAVIHDEVRRVQAALGALSVEQRRAVLLAALAGRTAREVGEIEGIPLGTAKTRIRTGLMGLRRQLNRTTEADEDDQV